MASLGYETRELGFGGTNNPEADKSNSLLQDSVDNTNPPQIEMGEQNQNENDKETNWSSVPTTDPVTADENESNIRDKLKCNNCRTLLKDSCSLQIKSTPYKSRIIQMPGYKINKENRKWIPSVVLAIILVLIGVIGGTLNLVDFKVGKICKDQSEKVDKYLNQYKDITNHANLKPIGPKAKNITKWYYDIGVNKYSYKYSEDPIYATIDRQYLFSVLMKNNTNLTQNCDQGSETCFLPEINRSYDCQQDEPDIGNPDDYYCVYDTGKIDKKGTKFPIPYRQSESDLIDKSQCTKSIWHCIPYPCGVFLKATCYDCAWYKLDCDVDLDISNGLLLDGDEWDKSLYSNFSNIDYEPIANAANQLLWEIYERANFLGSIYCLYMALMIFIGGPYVMTSTRLTTKIRVQLQNLTKLWFIAAMLLLWYFSELITLFWGLLIIDTDIHLILKFAMIDPCFADSTFITDLFGGAAIICGDIIYSKTLYEASRSNLMYYDTVEETYQYYYWADKAYIKFNPTEDIRYTYNQDSSRVFYGGKEILADRYDLVYDDSSTDCEVTQLLQYVGPGDSDFNFGAFLLFSSSIAALFLQPVLANLFKSTFIMIDPLAPYCGRIEIPYQHNPDIDEEKDGNNQYTATHDGLDEFEAGVLNEIQDENRKQRIDLKQAKEDEEVKKVMTFIKKWERTKNACPLCCWICLLIIILISTFSVAVSE